MTIWNPDERREIVDNDDLYISPFRADGTTYGTPTRVWAVVADDEVYVRPASGPASRWYLAAVEQKAGAVRTGGLERDVRFEQASDDVLDAVDAAYESKYPGSSAVPVMRGPGPRSATVRISPA